MRISTDLPSQGFATDCLAFDLYYTHPDDARLSSAKLVRRLKQELGQLHDPRYKPAIQSTIRAIEAGLRYRIQKADLTDVTRYLEAGVPVILAVNYSALHNLRGDPFEGHDIVITGAEEGTFFFIDPRHREEETITASDLLFAFLQEKSLPRLPIFSRLSQLQNNLLLSMHLRHSSLTYEFSPLRNDIPVKIS